MYQRIQLTHLQIKYRKIKLIHNICCVYNKLYFYMLYDTIFAQ